MFVYQTTDDEVDKGAKEIITIEKLQDNESNPFHRFQGCKFSLSCVVEKKYLFVHQTIDDEVDRAVEDYQEPVHSS